MAQKHPTDIANMLDVIGSELDLAYLSPWSAQIGVADLWQALWDEFQKMCGRYWVMGKSGHGPRGTFKVRVVNKEHPITSGLTDFEADDELYAKLEGDSPITVLVM